MTVSGARQAATDCSAWINKAEITRDRLSDRLGAVSEMTDPGGGRAGSWQPRRGQADPGGVGRPDVDRRDLLSAGGHAAASRPPNGRRGVGRPGGRGELLRREQRADPRRGRRRSVRPQGRDAYVSRLSDGPARMLAICTSGDFAAFVIAASRPAERAELPPPPPGPPTEAEVAAVTALAAEHGIDFSARPARCRATRPLTDTSPRSGTSSTTLAPRPSNYLAWDA